MNPLPNNEIQRTKHGQTGASPLISAFGGQKGLDVNARRLRVDFNGLFGEILCLSHSDTSVDETGAVVQLRAGMAVTAFDEDTDERGERDDLIATGIAEPSPEWLRCNGSKWVLRIDKNGVRHESEIRGAPEQPHAPDRQSHKSVE